LKKARDTYASYALAYLNSASQVTAANLDSLGICFASNIPASRLVTLSVNDFISRISYFIGLQTQLDRTSAAALDTLINNSLGAFKLEDLLLNLLQDAAIYSSNLNAISIVIIKIKISIICFYKFLFKIGLFCFQEFTTIKW
jgi:hypothetical protein